MAQIYADRVLETSTTTGTGTYTLAGAVTGYQTFAAVGNSNTCTYCAFEVDGNGAPSGGWEVGLGTYTSSGTTLARTTVYASTNGNAAVSWSAGTRRIALVQPATALSPFIPVQVILLQDQKAQNTSGGTFNSGAWRTRTLNTEVVDTGDNCTLASNQFTLSAGTYRIWARAPAYDIDSHQTRLQNATAGTTLLTGSTAYTGAVDSVMTDSIIQGRFTVAASQALELQHRCTNAGSPSNSFGVPANLTTEVYSEVWLEKEAF